MLSFEIKDIKWAQCPFLKTAHNCFSIDTLFTSAHLSAVQKEYLTWTCRQIAQFRLGRRITGGTRSCGRCRRALWSRSDPFSGAAARGITRTPGGPPVG